MSQTSSSSPGESRKLLCPACGATLTVKPPHAGKRAKCPGCAVMLQVSPLLDKLTVVGAASSPVAPAQKAAPTTQKAAPAAQKPAGPGQSALPARKASAAGPSPIAGAPARPQQTPAAAPASVASEVDFGSVPSRGKGKASSTKPKQKSKLVPIIAIAVLAVALLGAGGWAAMQFLGGPPAGENVAAANKANKAGASSKTNSQDSALDKAAGRFAAENGDSDTSAETESSASSPNTGGSDSDSTEPAFAADELPLKFLPDGINVMAVLHPGDLLASEAYQEFKSRFP